ncbi:MAG TPA: DUF4258 domain-containing protein [Candidatus Nanoarchaeia archaeon]|nr:DUF4258 domain-containing protein [Candidatus Nanoarchaeia archaeon]
MYVYAQHALEKMDSLGLERQEVEQAIEKGMKWKEQQREMWHAQMGGIEVVFAKENDTFIIVTVYLAGRSK